MKKTLSRFHAHRLQASDDFLLETKEKKVKRSFTEEHLLFLKMIFLTA